MQRVAKRRHYVVGRASDFVIFTTVAALLVGAAAFGMLQALSAAFPALGQLESGALVFFLVLALSLSVIHYHRHRRRLLDELLEHAGTEEALRKALEETGLQRTRTLALLNSARAVLEDEEPKEAALSIFESCRCLIGATAGYLLSLTDDSQVKEILAIKRGSESGAWEPTFPARLTGLSEQAAAGHRAIFNNSPKAEDCFVPRSAHLDIDNILYAPLANNGRVVGLLGMANKHGGFCPQDAEIALGFADLAAVALHNLETLRALRRSELRFRSVAETATDAIICTDTEGTVVFWNQQAELLSGYSAAEMLGRPLTTVIPERFRADYIASLAETASRSELVWPFRTMERAARRKDSSEFPIELSLSTWRTDEGLFITLIVRDVSARRQGEELLRKVARSSPIGIYVVENGKFRFVNPQFQRFTGYSEEDLLGSDSLRIVVPEDRSRVRECAIQMLRGERSAPYEYRIVTGGGDTRWILETVASIQYEGHLAAVGSFIDIHERKELEERLAYLATHDALTDLPNRRSLEEAMNRVVARARRGRHSTLLFLDVDDFKLVNDNLGHAAGDGALARISALLQDQLRAEDLLARLGGDEFAVLLEGVVGPAAIAVAERMRCSIESSPLMIDDQAFHLGLSIGMAVVDGTEAPTVVLSHADGAMYEAKSLGGNRIICCDPTNGQSRGEAVQEAEEGVHDSSVEVRPD